MCGSIHLPWQCHIEGRRRRERSEHSAGKSGNSLRRLNNIWKSGSLGLNIKPQLYTAVVVSTAICASETWKSTRMIQNKLDVFHQRSLRNIIGVTWKDKVSNAEVLARTGQRRLQDIVGERRFGLWSCHADGTRTPSPPRN